VENPDVSNGLNGSLIVTGQDASGQEEVLQLSTTGALTHDKVPVAISHLFRYELGTADGSL